MERARIQGSFVTRMVAAGLAALALLCGAGVRAESYPDKAVRFIVPFPPGGGADIVARLLARKLAERWGQQVVVDNRAGAGGVIGTDLAAAATPDGYTMLLGTLGTLSVNPHLYGEMKVDPARDFAPVTQLVNVQFALLANPAFPPNTVGELIALARAKPGTINYSSSGSGGGPHLAAELFNSLAGVSTVHVPYKGSGPGMQDLLAGQVSMTFDSLVQALPQVRAGKLKALAVLGTERARLLPSIPTMAEAGVPGYSFTNWFGLVVPKATPPALVARLHADVVAVMRHPEVREQFAEMGADVVGNSPQAFGEVIANDSQKWARLIRQAGIRAN
ncbi:MAG: Bug family tripartite tricarboxylate transporter substrate binding protein [Lautropia sp.]